MKYSSFSHIADAGDVINPQELSRDDRLERWALALDRRGRERLATLRGTEYEEARERHAMRQTNTPITVAYEDPVLRSAGLEDDSYGAAIRFFGVSDAQLHRVVCHCHFGESVAAGEAAAIVRSLKSDAAMRALRVITATAAAALLVAGGALLAL